MSIVPYQTQQTHLSVLPAAVRTAVAGYQTLGQIAAAVRKTQWFLSKSNNVRKSIMASLSSRSQGQSGISAPVALNTRVVSRGPRYRPGRTQGSMVISHREYLGEVTGNTTFGVTSRQVNPGLASTFPWLSSIANSYEQYKILSMTFSYVNIAATSERGRLTLAFDYDVLDEVPESKVDLFQVSGATEGSLWSTLSLNVKPSVKLFTRPGLVTGTDLKTYDHGQLLVGVSNTADTTVKGEIFVEYQVELFTPQPAKCPSAELSFSGSVTPFTYLASASVRGTLPITRNANNLFIEMVNTGTYIFSVLYTSTGANPGGIIFNTNGNTLYSGSAQNGVQTTSGSYRVRFTQPGGYVDLRPTSTFTALANNCYITVAYSNGY